MIENAEHVFRATRQAVVERGDEVKQEQRGAIDAERHDAARVAIPRGDHHQHHQAGQRQRGANQM